MTEAEFRACVEHAAPRARSIIDVSKFHLGDRCPRCLGRRVYVVDQDRNLWCCVPNAVPKPWRSDQVIEHDAAE
jgi:hypothetical protein